MPLKQAPGQPTESLPAPAIVYDDDRLREECGVFGVFGHPDAATLTALGLHALQHRGQEAAGIVSYDGRHFNSERRLGLVGDNFNRPEVIQRLKGEMAIGHNRYSTTGDTIIRNVQPLFADLHTGGFAVAHNGNLTNALELRRELISSGAICQSTSDTEVILHLLSRSNKGRIVERFVEAIRQIDGAYGLVCLTNDMMIGARDPVGIRPLVLGRLGEAYILASETCALDMVGAAFIREIENGEVVVITKEGIESHRPFPKRPARPCIFEYIYFARPDSVVGGRSVYEVRKRMGVELAREAPAGVDVSVPRPDSGVPAGQVTTIRVPWPGALLMAIVPPNNWARSRIERSPRPVLGLSGSKPAPLSPIIRMTHSRSYRSRISARLAWLWRAVLAKASWVMRNKVRSPSGINDPWPST